MTFDVNQLALRLYRSNAVWIVAWVVFVLIAATALSIMFWCWLSDGESNSTTIRNLSLVIAAIIGLPLVIWRSIVAERQADAAQSQAETAQRQSETAQRGLLNERYQKGAEMFGSGRLSVRLGGVYSLALLAREHPGDYHLEIVSLFCAFVRNPIGGPSEAPLPVKGLTPTAKFKSGWEEAGDEDGVDRPPRVREDVQAIMTAAGERSEAQIEIEKEKEYRLDLKEADLKNVYLEDANLEKVNLYRANLEGAVLIRSNLDGVHLDSANLEGASLLGSTLGGSNLTEADLSSADLRKCQTLTQEQVDRAVAQQDHPPDLTGAVDAKTGEPLVWRGGTPNG